MTGQEAAALPNRTRAGRGSALARTVAFALGVSWRASRPRTTVLVLVPLLQSLLPAGLALALRGLVNEAVQLTSASAGDRGELQFYVLLSLALSGLLALSQSIQQYLNQSNLEALEHHVSVAIIEHASSLEYGRFEDPEFRDTLDHVSAAPALHVHEALEKFVRALAALVTVGSLLVILVAIEARALLYFIPLTIPYLWFRAWVAKNRYLAITGQQRGRRWAGYYATQVTRPDTLPEVRMLDLAPLFVRRLRERLGAIHVENERSYRTELVGSAVFNLLAVGVVHLALYQAARRVTDGQLTVGDIAIFATAAASLRTAIDGLVMSIGALRWHTAHLGHLQAFFSIERAPDAPSPTTAPNAASTGRLTPEEPDRPHPVPDLVFEDVHFSYPGAPHPTLRGVSLRIAPGETVALVGRNGSGKSTLVKLAAGLYRPEQGHVQIAGRDTASATRDFLHDHCSIVFQQFGRYSATAGDNIAMGDWRALLDDPDRVLNIAARIGLDPVLAALPHGYDTLLGREFGDVDLSGGQWQTVAIARAFARETPVMILDEPTANLDAEAEYEVFSQFKQLAAGRATLLISHRFSTLALADRIVVLDDGRAGEQGTHDELVARGGTYAALFALYRRQGDRHVWDDEQQDGPPATIGRSSTPRPQDPTA